MGVLEQIFLKLSNELSKEELTSLNFFLIIVHLVHLYFANIRMLTVDDFLTSKKKKRGFQT